MRWILLFLLSSSRVESILETRQLDVYLGGLNVDTSYSRSSPSYTLLASQALFGSYPAMLNAKNPIQALALPPEENKLLCENLTSASAFTYDANTLLLVPRGGCTFEAKAARAQQLGANAVAIYGTLASRYSINTTSREQGYNFTESDVVFPLELYDYDCSKGRAEIPAGSLEFSPLPYNSIINDPLLMGNTSANLCLSRSPEYLSHCPSLACLLTGRRISATGNNSTFSEGAFEACCSWDLHIWLYPDNVDINSSSARERVNIPAVYLTMNQGKQLLQDFTQYSTVHVVLSARWRPTFNLSSYIIWALGVVIASLSAYLSAHSYHFATQQAGRRRPVRRSSFHVHQERRVAAESVRNDDSVELTAAHAGLFLLMASTALLALFFFKIYNVVRVLYAFGCSQASSQVVFDPIIRRAMVSYRVRNPIVFRRIADFENVSARDILSHICGYLLGVSWLLVGLIKPHPEEIAFFWLVQNLFGASMCILFLQVIKVNSLKIATLLLTGAFFYDIFFVFVSPAFFDKSVMITVATSGGPPTADPSWCEKYPTDKGCVGGDPLPMLFTIPRVFDYQGGSSLLGLGDIVLPGLLLSFAARFDAAKSMLGTLGGGNGRSQTAVCPDNGGCCRRRLANPGYFPFAVSSYAVGLLMANAAVYLMDTGQPALLYLVPCSLGTVTFLGWQRSELGDLWTGPVVIRTADDILFGQQTPVTSRGNMRPQSTTQDDEGGVIDPVEDGTRLLS